MHYALIFLEILVLVIAAAICSGLNIGLMALSREDLRRKAKVGNADAIKVLPLRERTHLSLVSILFINVAVVSFSSLLLEHYFNGIIAGIATTLLMVIFGEAVPQAFFVRFSLKFCALFSPLIWLMIFVTYPISKPLQLILDRLVGHKPHELQTRDELGLLIAEHAIAEESELDDDEVEIIKSALLLSEKTVGQIMEPIESVYWLKNTAMLDGPTVDEIKAKGFSRIPVFDAALTRCYGVLLMKDMVDIDFDEQPRPIVTFDLHETENVGSRTALDTMLRKFFSLKSHLVPIEKDDRIVGILTVEDLLEEVIGHEIADETDRALDRD